MTQNLIDASPTKNFFVEMLTRDIELKDAILDLLDNCIDGIQRTIKDQPISETPYKGFWAKIEISGEHFKIEDNCGGIPLDVAKRYAFRMGKPENIDDDNDIFTIGTYGIGMKRAIFKMGKSAKVISQTKDDSFEVSIDPEWLSSDDTWELPLNTVDRSLGRMGTSIEVLALREGIARLMSESPFKNSLAHEIEQLYSYIIGKGFKILVNDSPIAYRPIILQWEGIEKLKDSRIESIAPYLYEARKDDVEIELAVGFHRELPSSDEIDRATTGKRLKRDTAGWTIVCNDRVVVANDKTRLTGWGESRVPSYHPQFISISGIVHFRSKDASKLPITTTKRGMDASSDLYLYVKDRMREGLKIFTSYTNRWKTLTQEERTRTKDAELKTPNSIFESVRVLENSESDTGNAPKIWKSVKSSHFDIERRYVPNLPSPPRISQNKRISFSRPVEDVKLIADDIFEDPEYSASEVGAACFDSVLKEVKKQ